MGGELFGSGNGKREWSNIACQRQTEGQRGGALPIAHRPKDAICLITCIRFFCSVNFGHYGDHRFARPKTFIFSFFSLSATDRLFCQTKRPTTNPILPTRSAQQKGSPLITPSKNRSRRSSLEDANIGSMIILCWVKTDPRHYGELHTSSQSLMAR